MNNMANKFQVSTAKIRDELLKEGLIVADQYKNIGLTDKRNYAYRLTGKKLSQDSSLLSKQDIANAKNAGRPHNYNPHPITTFSRA